MSVRTAKQLAREAVERLPDDASIEDAMERLAFLAEIERGLADVDAGRTVAHEDVLARFAPPVGAAE